MQYKIVQVGHPALREEAQPLSSEEILSEGTQSLIADMCALMRAAPGVGLAATQIGLGKSIIVVEDRPEYTLHIPHAMLTERERKPFDLHVLINPKIIEQSDHKAEFYEGCLSVEGFVGMVPRYKKIKIIGFTEKAEPVTISAEGWYARILQHEIDHLNGVLYIDRMHLKTFTTVENYQKFCAIHPPLKIKK